MISILEFNGDKFSTKKVADFTIPEKLYGNPSQIADRILKTFNDRDKSLGVFFSGLKGNSKTTTAKLVSMRSNLDTILITEPFIGSQFQSFIFGLKKETIIFIDEFEKVYNTHQLQQEFLSILDGTYSNKLLFIFTSNSPHINEFLRNRPGRIFYHFKFDNLEPEVVDEIIEKELTYKDVDSELRGLLTILNSFSMDVLLNFIDEINRFKESPKKLIKGMNIEVEQTDFNVMLFTKGKRILTTCNYNPLTTSDLYLSYKDEDGRYGWYNNSVDNFRLTTRGNSFIFENKEDKLVFTPYKRVTFEL